MQMITPIAGRFVARPVSAGHVVLAGVLRWPTAFVPREGALYIAQWTDEGLQLHPTPALAELDREFRSHDLASLLTAPVWPRTRDARVFGMRFVSAFPELNQWTFAAVTGALDVAADDTAHAWYDVDGARCVPIAAPVDARGEAIRGLLQGRAIWPGPDGMRWTVPTMPAWHRPVYARYHRVLAQVGRGTCTPADAHAAVRRDPEMFELCAGRIDEDFCRYLAQLDESEIDASGAPVREDALRTREQSLDVLVRSLVVAQRTGELAGLPQAAGLR